MRFLRDCYRCGEAHDMDDEPEECKNCGAPWPTGEPQERGVIAMAQLSKPLILEAIRYIDEKRMHHLTLGEIRQLCFAWLHLHGHWKPDEPEPSIPTHEELVAIREIDAR